MTIQIYICIYLRNYSTLQQNIPFGRRLKHTEMIEYLTSQSNAFLPKALCIPCLHVSALIHVPVENESFSSACLTVKFAAVRHAQVRHL